MTKEAKVGMLTGLGVIVLIGVLLSEYLGDKNQMAADGPTGKMAQLPIGAAYRDQVTSPVGVPAMAPAGHTTEQLSGGTQIAAPVNQDVVVAMPVTDEVAPPPMGPVAQQTVSPVEAGPALADARTDSGGMPTISVRETMVPVKLQESKPAVVTHTIAAGDTLAKIARQYYGSAKNSDVQKIVAANRNQLKDASSMLVVTKKLVIPGVPAPVAPTMTMAGQVRPTVKPTAPIGTTNSTDGVIVYLPSSSMKDAVPPTAILGPIAPKTETKPDVKADAKKGDNKDVAASKKTYVVQNGDTLEKIARKLAPSKSSEMVQKLMALNGIKDPTKLQAGSPLKVPA